jgi:glutamyl-Q tRNA(Asp) synthetase
MVPISGSPDQPVTLTTRFAPSPTGPLHLGHAYSAMLAHDLAHDPARAEGGRFLLRIEDIDRARSRPSWEAQIFDDLHWLGLAWEEPVLRQSSRMGDYASALDRLWSRGLIYPCTCRRGDIELALGAPQEGVHLPHGPDGLIYPGTCRTEATAGNRPPDAVLRLNMTKALDTIGPDTPLFFDEAGDGPTGQSGRIEVTPADLLENVGDIVLARRDMGTSYHLSVSLDDAAQGVTLVVRGNDLFEATKIHIVLQRLLGLPSPAYHHHRLIRDDKGKRLAKRDDARAIAHYRTEGTSPQDIRHMVGLD